MRAIRCLIGGTVGGLTGAAVWAAVSYFTGMEIGWIAWGVGLLCGTGVALASGDAPLPGAVRGTIAAFTALFGVTLGKFVSVQLEINHHAGLVRAQLIKISDDSATGVLAARIAEQREAEGQKLAWPTHAPTGTASAAAYYPKDVWTDAGRQWRAMNAVDREGLRTEVREHGEAQIAQMLEWGGREGFIASFTPFDGLWGFLALGTAFRIGRASRGPRAQPSDIEASAMTMSPLSRPAPKEIATPDAEQSQAA